MDHKSVSNFITGPTTLSLYLNNGSDRKVSAFPLKHNTRTLLRTRGQVPR